MCIRDRYQRRVHGGGALTFEQELIVHARKELDLIYKELISAIFASDNGKGEKFAGGMANERLMSLKERLTDYCDDRIVATPASFLVCLLYTSPSPRDLSTSRMPSSA
eukprot:TRINITY_DN59877_c0_g1_i1.p3 TRINITY_DN59877_c0_g1~~TRINITY_DN59877_c0_g1_i1.p3  ORF type:complete len:108 (-),score=30.77 TRINITY_DN59877_c0_g1_i1:84-407(-)